MKRKETAVFQGEPATRRSRDSRRAFLTGRSTNSDPQLARTKKDLAAIHPALTAFKSQMGYFPGSDLGLDLLIEPPLQGKSPMSWKGPYLARDKRQFIDPWNTKYV